MPIPPRLNVRRPDPTAPIPVVRDRGRPVFTDPSGRRPRAVRLAGVGLGVAMLGCLAVMTAGLLGGPQASFVPGSIPGVSKPASPAVSGASRGRPGVAPSPAPGAAITAPPASGPGPSASASGATGSSPAGGSGGPSPAPTNRPGHTPPGRNRSPAPHPSRPAGGH